MQLKLQGINKGYTLKSPECTGSGLFYMCLKEFYVQPVFFLNI